MTDDDDDVDIGSKVSANRDVELSLLFFLFATDNVSTSFDLDQYGTLQEIRRKDHR